MNLRATTRVWNACFDGTHATPAKPDRPDKTPVEALPVYPRHPARGGGVHRRHPVYWQVVLLRHLTCRCWLARVLCAHRATEQRSRSARRCHACDSSHASSRDSRRALVTAIALPSPRPRPPVLLARPPRSHRTAVEEAPASREERQNACRNARSTRTALVARPVRRDPHDPPPPAPLKSSMLH